MDVRGTDGRVVFGAVLVVLILFMLCVEAAPAEQSSDRDLRIRSRQLSEEEWERILESDLSPDQIRGLLLEQGFPPKEVEAMIEARFRAEVAPPLDAELSFPAETPPDSLLLEPRAVKEEEPEVPVPPKKTPVIRPFGYDLFAQGPKSFTPPSRVAVGPDYLLGPDDTVVINAWGPAELSYSLTINPEGSVVIPEIGLVYLMGRKLGEAQEELRRVFEKYYPGINVHITVGQLRSLRVYVVGEVIQPGAYTVSSLSTVLTALYFAGGPSEHGSLRRIRLIRGDRTLAEIDLYRYLLKGDRSHDLRLQNEDTIFVPPVDTRVTLRGEIRRPAMYELLPDEGLREVIEMAGGALPTGYLKRVQIDRIFRNEKHVVLDVSLVPPDSAGAHAPVELADGDEVRLFPVLPGYQNAVWIRGAVKRPGRYELRDRMTLLDLIHEAEGLEGEAYLPRLEIERTEPNKEIRLLSANVGAILRGTEQDVPLVPTDSVRVYSVWEIRDRDEVEIMGEVRQPGRFPLAPNMTLSDLIFRAGGLKESAYLVRAEISRPRRSTPGDPRKSDVIAVRLTDVVVDGSGHDPEHLLQPGDKVFIRRIPQWDSLHTVTIAGEVNFPGTYALTREGETLVDLFERSGGVTDDAFLEASVLERKDYGRVIVDFRKAVLERNERENLALVDGDWVYVPKAPETVQVTGAVFQPSSLKFMPGRSADYYIEKCGGYLDRADLGRVRIIRATGAVEGSRRLWFDPKVERGNVIVVPFKEEKERVDWEKVAQITNVIAGLATTVYLVTEAFRN